MKRLVLAGAGHAHALVLRAWAHQPMPGVEVVVISPEPLAPYSGTLPRVAPCWPSTTGALCGSLLAGHADAHMAGVGSPSHCLAADPAASGVLLLRGR